MTNEELLKPRYKVIADYPLSHMYFKVGAILTWEGQYYQAGDNIKMHKDTVEAFPHLFKKLEWWEERNIEDMPEYVKTKSGDLSIDFGEVCKVIEWGLFPDEGKKYGNEGQPFALLIIKENTDTHDKGEQVSIHVNHLSPATKEEYENQK